MKCKQQLQLYFIRVKFIQMRIIEIYCNCMKCVCFVSFILFILKILFTQAHAASAVLNFSENCTPDILTPYLDGIVSKLLVLLQVY